MMEFGERIKKIHKQFGQADEYRGPIIGPLRKTTEIMLEGSKSQ